MSAVQNDGSFNVKFNRGKRGLRLGEQTRPEGPTNGEREATRLDFLIDCLFWSALTSTGNDSERTWTNSFCLAN